jgi:hypothetical protein
MPRVKHRGHVKRNLEAPLMEWPATELTAELGRLKTDPGDRNPWQVFKRHSEIECELDARGIECPA